MSGAPSTTRMLLRLGLPALFLAVAVASPPPAITWASQPTFPGETLLLHGAAFDASCVLNLTASPARGSASTLLSPIAGHVAPGSLKFSLPASLPAQAYSLALTCAGGSTPPQLLNAASPWWFQGDVGAASTAGGWIVIAGPVLAATPPRSAEAAASARVRAARDVLTAPLSAADDVWADASPLAAAAAELIAARAALAAARSTPPVTLRLTPVAGGAPIYITARADEATAHSANFSLPPALPIGEYTVFVANGGGEDSDANAPPGAGTFASAAFFDTAARPSVATIPVLPPRAWPAGVFVVDEPTDPCSPMPCPTSDASLARALAAAAAAGGGTVAFPRGAYFLSQPVVVPPNTVLSGAGVQSTAIWFQEWNISTAPKAPLFSLDLNASRSYGGSPCMGAAPAGAGLASWGLADLSVFITAFHNDVVSVSNASDGFVLARTRFRVNPFAFTWGTGPELASRGRVANFTPNQLGILVDIHGVNNRITHNDLFGVGYILNSFYSDGSGEKNMWPLWRRGHAYSTIADNVVYNGASSHFMQLWRQVLIVRNVFIGSTTTAGGQSLGTGPMGGIAQHVLHMDNTVKFTWGGDREVMTYDDAGGSYYGALASVDGATLTLANDAWPASDWEMGGWAGGQVIVLNGTGATQTARIAVAGVNVTPTLTNRTWTLAAPFAVTPDVGNGGSWVQVLPFRGRNIFFRDTNIETGPHQFYGHGVENYVTGVEFRSVRGLMAWGQWRGWKPPPPMNSSEWNGVGSERAAFSLGGLMGNGLQPNLHNQYRDVVFTERHHLTNYACGESGYVEQWAWKAVVAYPAAALNVNITNSPHALNVASIFRGSQVFGGFWIGNSTSDFVVEGSNVTWSDGECVVSGIADERLLAVDNACVP